jgi:2'-5' RNA ligase
VRHAVTGKPEGWVIPYLPGSLVILPPREVRERVNRLRRKYDPVSAWRIPPHITVTQPFRAEPGAAELALISRVLIDHQPVTLRFGPLRNFLPYPCIWFDVQPAEAVLALREELHRTGLFNTDLSYTDGFIPHMSITDGTPAAESTERLFRRVANRVRGGEFRVDELVYTRPDWQFRFLPVKSFDLGPS